MRPTFSVYIATSLEGFIARTDGAIDWLHGDSEAEIPGEDFGYAVFAEQTDCMVIGRGTFEAVRAFEPWPYAGRRVIVLSNSMSSPPNGFEDKIEVRNSAPAALAKELYDSGVRHVYLDGGKLIQSFMRAGLVDDMIVTRLPILIGAGRPLFGPLETDVRLKHDWTKIYDNGFVQSRYERITG